MNRALAHLIVKRDATGEALYAARIFRPADIVLDFAEVEWRPHRDRHTVQHPIGGHIYHPVLAKVSHSCDPNCEIVLMGRTLVAVRQIAPGEAISFDYTRTETRFAHPFDCLCGSPLCRGRIE
jgi:hypothetical protein